MYYKQFIFVYFQFSSRITNDMESKAPIEKRRENTTCVNNYFDSVVHFKQKRNIRDIKDMKMGKLTLFLVFGLLLK